MCRPQINLASASPRRRELLVALGITAHVVHVDLDETRRDGERPPDYVKRLALEKAHSALADSTSTLPVLAADTTVALEGRLFGKPRDAGDLLEMLGQLSGRTHEVYTGVALCSPQGTAERAATEVVRSEVTFREITLAEARAYWDTGEPADKAGGYAIQGIGAVFVRELRGSHSAVVGLPLYETARLLARAGIDVVALAARRGG